MLSLALLWYFSLVLAAFSLLVMLGLIFARLLRGSNAALDEQVSQSLISALLSDDLDDDERVMELQPLMKFRRRIAPTIIELSTVIRGPDFDRATDFLARAGAVESLIALLRKGRRNDRIAAAEALGYFRSEKARDALGNTLAGQYRTGLKVAAARALIEMGERPELADLFHAFDFGELEAPSQIVTILKMIASVDPEPLHRRVWMRVDPPALRAIMLDVLGDVAAFDSLPLIIRDTADEDSRVRAAAMDAIGQLGVPVDEEIIRRGLRDDASIVRAETVEAIGHAGLVSYAADLEGLLADREWDVRFRAAHALLQLDEDAQDRLQKIALADGQGHAGRTASLVLAERESKTSHA